VFLTAGVLLFVGCPGADPYPGEFLQTFRFSATLAESNCDPVDVPDAGANFEAILSREKEGSRAYLTVNRFARDAGFEGQSVVSAHAAQVPFDTCGASCEAPTLNETMRFTLLSQSQLDALGGKCPTPLADGTVALDGGVAANLDAGTFDAVRACGRLVDEMMPGNNCTCSACKATYLLEGAPL